MRNNWEIVAGILLIFLLYSIIITLYCVDNSMQNIAVYFINDLDSYILHAIFTIMFIIAGLIFHKCYNIKDYFIKFTQSRRPKATCYLLFVIFIYLVFSILTIPLYLDILTNIRNVSNVHQNIFLMGIIYIYLSATLTVTGFYKLDRIKSFSLKKLYSIKYASKFSLLILLLLSALFSLLLLYILYVLGGSEFNHI